MVLIINIYLGLCYYYEHAFLSCRKGEGNVKTAITEKRKLSADLNVTRAHLGLKNREGTVYNLRQLNIGNQSFTTEACCGLLSLAFT